VKNLLPAYYACLSLMKQKGVYILDFIDHNINIAYSKAERYALVIYIVIVICTGYGYSNCCIYNLRVLLTTKFFS